MKISSLLILLLTSTLTILARDYYTLIGSEYIQTYLEGNDSLFIVESFSEYPAEIDGGSCDYFLSQSDMDKNRYIMVNDFGQKAFMKINGKTEILTLTSYSDEKQEFSNSSYVVSVEITSSIDGQDESTTLKGTIKIQNKYGKIQLLNFICQCSC